VSFNRNYQILSKVYLLERIMTLRNITLAQDQLSTSVEFNSLDAFRCIDTTYLGFITIESLNEFLRSNNSALSYDEL